MTLRQAVERFRGRREFHVAFIPRRRLWFLVSGAIIVLSAVGLLWRGLNLGIDFEGGALLRYENRTGVTADEVRRTMASFGRDDAVVQLVDDGNEVTVRTSAVDEERSALLSALAEQAGIRPADISVDLVGPKWGEQISRKALQGLLIFLAAVTVYISFRFEWKMAAAAIVALLHDLVITGGVYALSGREVTPETVIAILTIMGYSLYDTVVIFDKVKENAESPATVQRLGYAGAVNLSLNQVLMRSVNTSLTSLIPIGALLFLGGDTLKNFAFALFVGVAAGTYSSIFVAAPILTLLKEREPRLRALRAPGRPRPSLRPVPEPAPEPEPEPEPVGAPPPSAPRPGGARSTPPRRRPKKKSRAKRKRR